MVISYDYLNIKFKQLFFIGKTSLCNNTYMFTYFNCDLIPENGNIELIGYFSRFIYKTIPNILRAIYWLYWHRSF